MALDPISEFQTDHYYRHNQRRLEHLATLGLPLAGRSVIEVGAGIGDHTSFFLDRGCSVLTSDGRTENVELLRRRYSRITVRQLDLDDPDPEFREQAEIVYCYGTLYHLRRPAQALTFLARCCTSLMLIETCVSFGDDERLDIAEEDSSNPSQALSGIGCRPTRLWVHRRLSELFHCVYMPRTQPWHPEFPIDWTTPDRVGELTRAIFIASRTPLRNQLLTPRIQQHQERI
ncbi:MAG: class I SAM-dependent methyltransferase [Actinobacteria bacterium]|nr:class I SAM-dependent methyltransferase [Actinomycetota bacterium]